MFLRLKEIISNVGSFDPYYNNVSPVMNVSDKIQVQLQPSMEMLHLYGQKK
jgi:hypothetical protein